MGKSKYSVAIFLALIVKDDCVDSCLWIECDNASCRDTYLELLQGWAGLSCSSSDINFVGIVGMRALFEETLVDLLDLQY